MKSLPLSETISLAAMVSHTTRYARYFYRLLASDILLYTEMITTSALIRNRNLQQIQRFDDGPAVCQLAGSKLVDMIESIKIVEDYGYEEINLNLGCPSKQVQNNQIGVCMMKRPQELADLFYAIDQTTELPISIKCRIGVDDYDSYDHLCRFIQLNAEAGCKKFIIHARKAWLHGLNTKQNRTVPPIDYHSVYKIKKDFPKLDIIINGDIRSLDEVQQHLGQVDGVMLGRVLLDNPLLANQLQNRFCNAQTINLKDLLYHYLNSELYLNDRHHLSSVFLLKHLFGLATHKPGAKKWRQFIVEQMKNSQINADLIIETADRIGILEGHK